MYASLSIFPDDNFMLLKGRGISQRRIITGPSLSELSPEIEEKRKCLHYSSAYDANARKVVLHR